MVLRTKPSNRFLARTEFFELFRVESKPFLYHLRTCSGIIKTYGKRAEGFQIESLEGKVFNSLPPLLECTEIPNNQVEIPTSSAVLHQPHLHRIATFQKWTHRQKYFCYSEEVCSEHERSDNR